MLLCEQAWSLMVKGHTLEDVATRMDRTPQQVSTYLWYQKRALGLKEYPFAFGKKYRKTLQAHAWTLALQGGDKHQIAQRMHKSWGRVDDYLRSERKRLGLATYPFPMKRFCAPKQRLGNIYHPEVDHRQLFKELAQ